MPFNAITGVYTGVSGSTNATPGQVIRSATWDNINTDVATALTQLAAQYWVGGTNAMAVGIISAKANVNFNSASADTALVVTLPVGFTRYRVSGVFISGATASIASATCGVFTAAAGGGATVVAAGTAVTVTSSAQNTNNNMQSFTIVNQNTQSYNVGTLYFRMAVAEGIAATGVATVHIQPVS